MLMPCAAQLDLQHPIDSRLEKVLDDRGSGIAKKFSKARNRREPRTLGPDMTLSIREHLAERGVCSYVQAKETKGPVFAFVPGASDI